MHEYYKIKLYSYNNICISKSDEKSKNFLLWKYFNWAKKIKSRFIKEKTLIFF